MALMFEKRKEERIFVGPVCVYPFPSHLHDAAEFVTIRKGYLHMTVDGVMYHLEPNTILTVFPNAVHSYESASEDAEGLSVAFVPESVEEFTTVLKTQRPANPLLKITEKTELLDSTIRRLEKIAEEGKPSLLIPALIHLLVACLLDEMTMVPLEYAKNSQFLYDVLAYVTDHYTEDLSLDSISKALGIGKNKISQFFSQSLHVNFRRFLNTLRIEKSCVLLQDPSLSIKEVGYMCGFENTRTFHRLFQEERNMTPREFREQVNSGWMTVQDSEGDRGKAID